MNRYRRALHKVMSLISDNKGHEAVGLLCVLLNDKDLLFVNKNNLSIEVSEVMNSDMCGYRAVITNEVTRLATEEEAEQFGKIIIESCVEKLYRYLEEGKDNEN